ncbi:MAG: hypothetical protein ACJ76Z_00630 [Thermoleophilaceae bacterium]
MSKLLRATLAIGLVLSLVAAGGCGGDTQKKNDYVKAINKVQTDFANAASKLQAGGAGSGEAGAKKTFANLKAAIDKVVADLQGVKPPDSVKALHNELIGEMKSFGQSIQRAGASLGSKDPQKILAAQTQFATDAGQVGAKIGATIDKINTELHK